MRINPPLDAKKPNRILLLTITFLLIILLPILVIVVRERTSFTGRAVRTASFTCTESSPCVGKIISETIYPPTPVPFPTGRPTPQTTRPPFPPRTNYYLEMDSKLYLLMMKMVQIDFSQYADSEREVVVLGEGSAGLEMNVGGNLLRRAIGVIVVSDISWAD